MPVKYFCPKCNRRFADWGAQKLGFKCPHDENCPPGTEDEVIELLRVGGSLGETLPEKPTLKRKKAAAPAVVDEADLLVAGDDLEVVSDLDADLEEEDTDVEEEVAIPVKRKKVATDSDDGLSDDDEDDSPEPEVEALDFEETDATDISEGFVEVEED